MRVNWVIRRITAEEPLPIRGAVLRQGMPEDTWRFPEDKASGTIHIGAFHDGVLCGVCTIFPEKCPSFEDERHIHLRGMAVLPAWRGMNAGSALLQSAAALAHSKGATLLWCNVRESAAGFYGKQGLCQIGDRFMIEGIGWHVRMFLSLRGSYPVS